MTDEQRAERLRYHMYESCEGIREHDERIVALKELVEDMWHAFSDRGRMTIGDAIDMGLLTQGDVAALTARMAALGIEVKG